MGSEWCLSCVQGLSATPRHTQLADRLGIFVPSLSHAFIVGVALASSPPRICVGSVCMCSYATTTKPTADTATITCLGVVGPSGQGDLAPTLR